MFEKFTDEQVAAISFALDLYDERIYHSDYTKEFCATLKNLRMLVNKEYDKRDLHWSEFERYSGEDLWDDDDTFFDALEAV